MGKKIKIPKIDLSKYSDQERLPEYIEQIIINGLIYFECSASKVAKYFNISIDTVNMIYIKWYSQLAKAMNMKEKSDELDEAINTGIDLMKNHLKEVKENRDNSSSNIMSASLTRNVNSIVDRLVTIKENSSRTYDTVTNKLIDNIVKVKTLEKLEQGVIEDNSDYLVNNLTVSERMEEYLNKTNAEKLVKVTYIPTGESETFKSLTEACTKLNANISYVSSTIIPQKKLWKKDYRIEYLDD